MLIVPVNEIPTVFIDPVYPVFSEDEDYFLSLVEDDPNEKAQYEKYTELLWKFSKEVPPFVCNDRCKAPNGFFLGSPWMKTTSVTARAGNKVDLICQIWNGVATDRSSLPSANVTLTHIGSEESEIYKKETIPGIEDPSFQTNSEWTGIEIKEEVSPGSGHFSDFHIHIKNFTASMAGNISCENGVESSNNLATLVLRVDGRWTEWGRWSQCSKSCVGEDGATGVKRRSRECIPPENGGNPCEGLAEEQGTCPWENDKLVSCPIDHSFSEWSRWSACTPRCGDGSSFRVRSCKQGQNGGSLCPEYLENLAEKEQKKCKVKDCPGCIPGSWNAWSTCSKSCLEKGGKPGRRSKTRATREADPSKPKCVPEDHTKIEFCNTNGCPIDGYLTKWTKWTPSDSECGKICTNAVQKSSQTRSRWCNQPENGGNPCPSSQALSEKRDCPTSSPCPIDCEWKQWGQWSECTKNCGPGGKKERSRSKKEVNANSEDCRVGPCYGGQECEGSFQEESDCFVQRCPDCGWSPWGKWSSCPAQCNDAKQARTRKQVMPENTDSFSGLTLNCSGKDTQLSGCDGRETIVAEQGYARWRIDDACNKDPGSTCFAKGSKVITERGEIAIEELQLGDEVQTVQNGNPQMTPFLGWIHKEDDHMEQFVVLKTESAKITLSAKHVIFRQVEGSHDGAMTTTFADLVSVGDVLEVIVDGQVERERVVRIDKETKKGTFAPLTASGTILVDNVLASCYADFLFQSVADVAFYPVKLLPWLLENEGSQTKDGLRLYPKLFTWFGRQINMVETYKGEFNLSVPFAMLLVGIARHLSY